MKVHNKLEWLYLCMTVKGPEVTHIADRHAVHQRVCPKEKEEQKQPERIHLGFNRSNQQKSVLFWRTEEKKRVSD